MLNYIYRLRTTTTHTHYNYATLTTKTLYQVLEVPNNATTTIIKKNYLKLAKIYHPDLYKGNDRQRFQKIQEAYKTLTSQTERNKYDESIGLTTAKT